MLNILLNKIIQSRLLTDDPSISLTLVGSDDQWHCDVSRIESTANIICAGVGGAITFEHELVRRTGCKILLLDPSPTGIKTMEKPENMNPSIEFWPIGLAGKDGQVGFGRPDNMAEGSWKVGDSKVEDYFACRSVSSLMRQKNYTRLDLLKIDIEGFEYEVIDDILNMNIHIDQILVEFHDNSMINIDKSRWSMLSFINRLRQHGYRFVHMRHTDCTFIK